MRITPQQCTWQTDQSIKLLYSCSRRLAAHVRLVSQYSLDHLRAHRVHGIQRIHSRLKHHRDLTPTHLPHLGFGQIEQIAPGKIYPPLPYLRISRQKPEYSMGNRRLAGTGFTDQT